MVPRCTTEHTDFTYSKRSSGRGLKCTVPCLTLAYYEVRIELYDPADDKSLHQNNRGGSAAWRVGLWLAVNDTLKSPILCNTGHAPWAVCRFSFCDCVHGTRFLYISSNGTRPPRQPTLGFRPTWGHGIAIGARRGRAQDTLLTRDACVASCRRAWQGGSLGER